MNILFYDLETNTLEDAVIIEIGYEIFNLSCNRLIKSHSEILKTDRVIDPKASEANGITKDLYDHIGRVNISSELSESILQDFRSVDIVVGHNIKEFDNPILNRHFLYDLGYPDELVGKIFIDTLKDFKHKDRHTNLGALHVKYTNVGILDAHTALADVQAVRRVFLNQLKEISLQDYIARANSKVICLHANVDKYTKDKAKACGFRYNGKDYKWYKYVKEIDRDEEKALYASNDMTASFAPEGWIPDASQFK